MGGGGEGKSVDPQAVRAVLAAVRDPASGEIPNWNELVDSIETRGNLVQIALKSANRRQAEALEPLRRAAQSAISHLPGVSSVAVILTAHREAPPAPSPPPSRQLLAEAEAVIAVASGKGGVGKSTIAVNLAVALAQGGARIGLLDADIYGPSLPRMLGLSRKPQIENEKMVPLSAWGLAVMSIGFLVSEETAMIWRGPMVMGALEQMMRDVAWGKLDIMVVDMPPGTGDAALTLAQRVALAGAVIVSTPQDVALVDARRGAKMFERVRVPVLGIVENMSYYRCPHCGHRAELFGHGGARREAERLGVPFLGEVPLIGEIRASGDAGTPIAATPESEAAACFAAIAAAVRAGLAAQAGSRAGGPHIVVE